MNTLKYHQYFSTIYLKNAIFAYNITMTQKNKLSWQKKIINKKVHTTLVKLVTYI